MSLLCVFNVEWSSSFELGQDQQQHKESSHCNHSVYCFNCMKKPAIFTSFFNVSGIGGALQTHTKWRDFLSQIGKPPFGNLWIKLCCVNIDQSNVIGMVLPLPPPATDWTQSAWFDLAAKQLGPVLAFCQLLNSANDPVLSATIAGIIIICRVEADKI